MLIVNADDLGFNEFTTSRILMAFETGRITSTSAMVFMADSERSAEMALDSGLDVGLHLNFTARFSGHAGSALRECQQRIATFLLENKYYLLMYNPFLKNQFEYVYQSQYEEFTRLYNKNPSHTNGHHHMHLCTNVIVGKLIPRNSKIRKNFSFTSNEKNFVNRLYRHLLDRWLKQRYVTTDFFFSISSVFPAGRLEYIAELSRSNNVELMVHPHDPDEFKYLMTPEYFQILSSADKGTYLSL